MKQDIVKCIITGCALRIYGKHIEAWGDLHQTAQCYIFNAVLSSTGETAWRLIEQAGQKALVINSGGDYFERRGVFVIPSMNAQLNPAAVMYVR